MGWGYSSDMIKQKYLQHIFCIKTALKTATWETKMQMEYNIKLLSFEISDLQAFVVLQYDLFMKAFKIF